MYVRKNVSGYVRDGHSLEIFGREDPRASASLCDQQPADGQRPADLAEGRIAVGRIESVIEDLDVVPAF